MSDDVIGAAEDPDAAVDQQISEYVNPHGPRSFFLYAGAGSGKTRTLVNTLNFVRETYGAWLWLRGKRAAVITYTNAAADEVMRRAKSDPLFEVSTIHSFVWSLLAGHNHDIREWLRGNLQVEIEELEQAQLKGRASKASEQRARSIVSKQERLANLDAIRVFTYNPNGDNRERDSLNHAEIIKMGSEFLTTKPALRRLVAGKYPVILIDESQDTNRHLVDALLHLEDEFQASVCIGFIGDTMQRIYADGKAKLPDFIPERWARPSKVMNHRSAARIIELINKVRADEDDHVQQARADKPGGVVRMFLAPSDIEPRFDIEARTRARMAEVTGDADWNVEDKVKVLGLEHHMLARRMGFADLFGPLYAVDRFKTGLLDGSLPALRLFTADVLPVVAAQKTGDAFLVTSILRKRSPLLQTASLERAGANQPEFIKRAKDAVEKLCALWDDDADPICRDVLTTVAEGGLFVIPEALRAYVERADQLHAVAKIMEELGIAEDDSDDDQEGEVSASLGAWDAALDTPMSQMQKYADYVAGNSSFDTHQGVKGLEFPRVMVVIDDNEARGFMFSYEKLLGAQGLSAGDVSRQQAGEETTVDRTRRLFYVTASRAEESLAIVVYTSNPAQVKSTLIDAQWFNPDEVVLIESPSS